VPAVALNDRNVRSLPVNSDTPDSLMPGLVARRRAGNVAWWFIAMRSGRRVKKRLGTYPAMTLADARDHARRELLALETGTITAPAGTFGTGIALYLGHLDATAKDAGQVRWLFDRFVVPPLGDLDLARLHRRDLQAVVDRIATGNAKVAGARMSKSGSPSTAARVASMMCAALNWLHKRGHIDAHPCPTGLASPSANPPRERILTDTEIVAVWNACEGREPAGRVMRLLLLTACRREEVNGLTEGEVQRDSVGVPVAIVLPASRTKNGRPHIVPLSAMAAALIAGAPHTGDVLFPGRSADAPFKGWSRAVEDVQRISGTDGWTPHDLRRTAASGMARLGIRPDIIDRVLNHAPPRLRGTYDRHDYRPEMATALNAWAEHVATLRSRPLAT